MAMMAKEFIPIMGLGDDINFESEEFNRRYHVKCEDPQWARAVIPAESMKLLLAVPSGFIIEFGYDEIIVFRVGYCRPHQYRQAFSYSRKLIKSPGPLRPISGTRTPSAG